MLKSSPGCAKVIVGDPHQQIYGFRGARGAMKLDVDRTFYLTQVWCLHIVLWHAMGTQMVAYMSLTCSPSGSAQKLPMLPTALLGA